jgi:N-acetylmuramoyl-L-alanine amidase
MKVQIESKLLTPNKYSRPQSKLNKVKAIVIHWVANPNSTAIQNRNFFENRKSGKSGYGSAHYIVGAKGEIIQCLPDEEMAYHVGSKTYTKETLGRLGYYPNSTSLGIEMCHPDWTGKPTIETYHATINLTAHLLKKYNLTIKDIWLHKEVVGWKQCHKYYCDNPGEWDKFKSDVNEVLNGNKQGGNTQMEQWKIDMGKKAVQALHEKELINDPSYWDEKLDKPAENWLFFELLNRIAEKVK